jgi:hypothetical protein
MRSIAAYLYHSSGVTDLIIRSRNRDCTALFSGFLGRNDHQYFIISLVRDFKRAFIVQTWKSPPTPLPSLQNRVAKNIKRFSRTATKWSEGLMSIGNIHIVDSGNYISIFVLR